MSRRLVIGRRVELTGSYWVGSSGTVTAIDRAAQTVTVELDHHGTPADIHPHDLRVIPGRTTP